MNTNNDGPSGQKRKKQDEDERDGNNSKEGAESPAPASPVPHFLPFHYGLKIRDVLNETDINPSSHPVPLSLPTTNPNPHGASTNPPSPFAQGSNSMLKSGESYVPMFINAVK